MKAHLVIVALLAVACGGPLDELELDGAVDAGASSHSARPPPGYPVDPSTCPTDGGSLPWPCPRSDAGAPAVELLPYSTTPPPGIPVSECVDAGPGYPCVRADGGWR